MSKDTERWGVEGNEILSHIPTEFSEEVKRYARDVVLERSRYLFVRRENKELVGYCTHCQQEHAYIDAVKYGQEIKCIHCKSICIMKQNGRGRKYLNDDGYFVWFDKSIKDPNVLVARGIYVQRDYSQAYEKVQTTFAVTAAYVFGDGQSKMVNRTWWGGDTRGWYLRSTVFSESGGAMSSTPHYMAIESIERAVKDTPFQYSTWEHYKDGDLIKLFDVAAKYPCIEYLTKLGLTSIVRAKIQGGRTYGAINWRAKKIDAVLKVTKQDLLEIRKSGLDIRPFTLWLFQQFKKEGAKVSILEVHGFVGLCGGNHIRDDIQLLRKTFSLNQIRNFTIKQYQRKNPKGRHYWSGSQVLVAWRDYLSDARRLGMEVTDESILYPSNLYQAHQKLLKKIKILANKALNDQIKHRLPMLAKYKFESDGFIIRPAESSDELIREGNALKHCVGTYAKRYAEAQIDLFVIRKESDPDKPFYTLEVRGGAYPRYTA